MFDWKTFLDQHQIEYLTQGKNVARDHIAVRCPLCQDDPSHHMSISLKGDGWHCWRNHDHSGHKPIKLVMGLINCSYQAAVLISGSDTTLLPDDLSKAVNLMMQDEPDDPTPLLGLEMPEEFRKFSVNEKVSDAPYRNYLKDRGVNQLYANRYDLRYCTHGPFKGRIIFPIYEGSKLVSWTGRTISERELVRYKECPTELSGVSAKNYLIWLDELINDQEDVEDLVLTEGPFDALRINIMARSVEGVGATCFMTSAPSPTQLELLKEVISSKRFGRVIILLDQGNTANAYKLQSNLMPVKTIVKQLPPHRKDPAELSKKELLDILYAT